MTFGLVRFIVVFQCVAAMFMADSYADGVMFGGLIVLLLKDGE